MVSSIAAWAGSPARLNTAGGSQARDSSAADQSMTAIGSRYSAPSSASCRRVLLIVSVSHPL
jgi:hypothetical protein